MRVLCGLLSPRECAEAIAAIAVVGSDTGLTHVAGALDTPTFILFGPTPHLTLGRFPSNVKILRAGLPCEPCWFARRFQACAGRIDCFAQISVATVAAELLNFLSC